MTRARSSAPNSSRPRTRAPAWPRSTSCRSACGRSHPMWSPASSTRPMPGARTWWACCRPRSWCSGTSARIDFGLDWSLRSRGLRDWRSRTLTPPLPQYAKSIELHERARKVMAGGVSSGFRAAGKPVPLFFERGEGAILTDVDGNTYIDYVLGLGPAILGHAPKRVLERVASTLGEGQLYAAPNLHELKLAERLSRLIPAAEMVRFASSGTEAVQAPLRLARAYSGRTQIVKFEGHYHGRIDTIAVSVKPALDAAGPVSQPIAAPESPGQPDSP